MDPLLLLLTSGLSGLALGAFASWQQKWQRNRRPALTTDNASEPLKIETPGPPPTLEPSQPEASPSLKIETPPPPTLEPSQPSQPEASPSPATTAPTDVENPNKCPCGLVLPEPLMTEHVQSTGHSSLVPSAKIRVGKIWELQEAVIETASPACSRCGKPVHGLNRIGKTIYVSHMGCQDTNKRNESGGENGDGQKVTDPSHVSRPRRIEKCPICWKPVTRRKGFTQIVSVTGGKIRFHDTCLNYGPRTL